MAEVINTNVFDATKKFVDLAGLDYFWEKAKAYVDGVDTTLSGKITDLETAVDALTTGDNSVAAQIDAKIAALDVTDTAVEGQYVSAVSEEDGKVVVTRAALPDYTNTYDAKGAAAAAQTAAQNYADTAVSTAVGTWTDGETAGTGLRKEIEEKVAAVAADAKSYSIAAVTGDELAGLGANVKEAYKLVDEDGTKAGEVIKIYKDSALQSVVLDGQELVFTYLLTTGAEDVVRVDVSNFLAESEFKDGLQVVDHVVSVKVDSASEGFLTVGADGIKLSGVQDAINTADATNLQAAKDYADGLKTELEGVITDNERVTAESLNDLNNRVNAIAGQDVYVKADVDAQISAAQAAAEANANAYTDQLKNSIQIASNADIDGLFA